MKQPLRFLSLFILALLQTPSLQSQDVPDNLTLREIFHEPVIPGIRPSFDFISGDQRSVFFSWNDSSYYETGLYSVDLGGNNLQKEDDETETPVHSPDGTRIAYTIDGDLFVASPDDSDKVMLFASKDREFRPEWSPDSEKIAFQSGGDVWISYVNKPGIMQVTEHRENDSGFSLNGWAGNEKLLVRQTDYSGSRTLYFPEYVDEFVEPGTTNRGIPETSLFVASLDTTALDTLLTGLYRISSDASESGRYAAVDYSDAALKHRKIVVHDIQEKDETIVFEDSTEGWLYQLDMAFAPGSDKLMVLSEQSGWNHIYTVNPDGSSLTRHTSGDYSVSWAEWIGSDTIVYASNEDDYGERDIYLLNTDSGESQKLTDDEAYRYQFRLTPDRRNLIYAKTFFNEPYDLYRLSLENPGEEIRLTHSVPDRFREYNWQREEYVRFTGRDGETDISMSVLYPKDFAPSQTYPVVVFAHGAGSLQNVYRGWSNNYWREYMFNQFLNLHGYVVVDVDFRHSTGYGRKFREDVTNWMGKYETEDIIDGLDWVQEKTGGALDLDHVGIYGGSYGGFMALYAVTHAPERFHAAAALRKVTNWRNYYHANPWYTLPRLGDPEEVPEHYDRSSPLTYASELTRPVLLLHGMVDDNVGFQDTAQYIEELIQSGNENFEMMMYPSEAHGFTDPDSWYDEYRRMFEFFEEHLK